MPAAGGDTHRAGHVLPVRLGEGLAPGGAGRTGKDTTPYPPPGARRGPEAGGSPYQPGPQRPAERGAPLVQEGARQLPPLGSAQGQALRTEGRAAARGGGGLSRASSFHRGVLPRQGSSTHRYLWGRGGAQAQTAQVPGLGQTLQQWRPLKHFLS